LGIDARFVVTSPFVARSRRGIRVDLLQWLMCFFSIEMLMLQQSGQNLDVTWVATLVTFLFLLPWAAFCVLQPSAAIVSLISNWPLLTLPLFAMVSTVWSQYPDKTLRAGVQFFVTTMIGIWIATWVKPRTFLSAFLAALAIVAALSAIKDILTLRSFNVAFIGIFGSKNYFAFSIALLLLSALNVALDRFQSPAIRLIGFAAALFAPPLLVLARSTGALVFTAATVAILSVLALGGRLPPNIRFLILVICVLLAITIGIYFGDVAQLLDSVGKDSTLTGRTVLWGTALRSIADHPTLGLGYQAFWQQGNWGAEVLWEFSHITERMGFHFHSTYLQVAVDLGLVGLSIFIAIILTLVLRVSFALIFLKPRAEQMFAISIVIFLLFRTPIEIDLFYQFQIGSILLCLAWVYLKVPQRQTVSRSRAVGFAASNR
jgi:exopolysaccharide production protein ExoQ